MKTSPIPSLISWGIASKSVSAKSVTNFDRGRYVEDIYIPVSFIASIITLLFSILIAQPVFAQCNVMCLHERGNSAVGNNDSSVTNESGLLLEPSYEVAINDSYYTEAEGDENSLHSAASETGTETTYIEAPSY